MIADIEGWASSMGLRIVSDKSPWVLLVRERQIGASANPPDEVLVVLESRDTIENGLARERARKADIWAKARPNRCLALFIPQDLEEPLLAGFIEPYTVVIRCPRGKIYPDFDCSRREAAMQIFRTDRE